MPYQPTRRHQYWYIDLRYLVRLDADTDTGTDTDTAGDDGPDANVRRRRKHWTYSICIIEGYSRKILAGLATEHQDSLTVLQLLRAAVEVYGCPEGIVSDNGSVFTGQDYTGVLSELEITPCYIDKGKPWQNLIEAQFKVQLRLADAKFEKAAAMEEVQEAHAEFICTFNETPHWAHKERPDGLRCPVEVLQWVRGRPIEVGELEQIFKSIHLHRVITTHGFVRIQRFYLYAERGLARQRVAIWIYEGHIQIEYEATLLTQYEGKYDREHKQLQEAKQPGLYHTGFASPQLELWELDEAQWLKIREVPIQRLGPRRSRRADTLADQLPVLCGNCIHAARGHHAASR